MSLVKELNEKLKEIKDRKKDNKLFKNLNFIDQEYIKRQDRRLKWLLNRSTETAIERKIWNKYQSAVLRSFKTDNPERKFRLKQVEDLGLEWQILFLYSKKDIGKTRQLGTFLTNVRAKDPTSQVVFIRNTREEVEDRLPHFTNYVQQGMVDFWSLSKRVLQTFVLQPE